MQDGEAEAYASTAIPEGGGRNLPWAGIGAESRTAAAGLPKTKAMGDSQRLSLFHEPPDTERSVRWCGRTAGAIPPPTRSCARQGGLTWRCKSSTHPARGSVS